VMSKREYRMIYCCGCEGQVKARLTDGLEIYPHNHDTCSLPFWKCDECGNYVGCHHKHEDFHKRTDPLGVIPTPELRNARKHIHSLIDPVWKEGHMKRHILYFLLSMKLGYDFHTSGICTIEEARRVYRDARSLLDNELKKITVKCCNKC